MRRLILGASVAAMAGAPLPSTAAPAAIEYRTAEEVAAARASGELGGPVISQDDFRVFAVRRDKVGESEVHKTETDVFFVVDGKATVVVGGEMVGGRETAPGELRGSAIAGGKDYALEPGVVLTIPHGTPHWIRETTPGFRYVVVKTPAR